MFAIVGSMMVSYVRAKSEAMGISLPRRSCAVTSASPTRDRPRRRAGDLRLLRQALRIENVATLAIVGFVAVLANYAGLS